VTTDVKRYCQLEGCRKQIQASRGLLAKYCTKQHGQTAAQRRFAAKKKAEKDAERIFDAPREYQHRLGDISAKLRNDPLLPLILDGTVPPQVWATKHDVSLAAVTRSLHGLKVEGKLELMQDEWEPSWRVKALLPYDSVKRVKELGHASVGSEEFESLVDELVRAYSAFSRWYFNLEGKRPIIKGFHLQWIRSIIVAYATGGKQLILAPPRVGKSETLIRFCVWFITMDPNIRIGWFCAGTDIAKLMLGSVKDYFENHEAFIADTLPPGQAYKPERSTGRAWNAKEIKVAQQSHIGAKSSSLLALGRTSKFLSRDMDIIIIDDMEDFDDTNEPHMREKGRQKLAEIGTRKTEDTAEVYIGSRQHPDDIPNYILGMEGSILQWKVLVNSAHDEDCGIDPEAYDQHIDCMLFPEVRSYRYLMEKKLEMETLGLQHAYPMRYLNQPVPAEGQVFDMAQIRENALDKERGLGLEGLPIGRLAAGLDPSARGIQAAFLWHYTPQKMSMVDLDTEQSGGQEGAIRVIYQWFHEYDLQLWFYETNSQQVDWYDNIKKHIASKGCTVCGEIHPEIQIKDHNTGGNKKDAELGISSMAPRYHDGRISLPHGTVKARQKVNRLLRQLELWTSDGIVKKSAKTDIKMASWFPFPYFVKLERKDRTASLHVASESSYPGYGNYTESPWQQTQYPGG
jgi:hypothetical protein